VGYSAWEGGGATQPCRQQTNRVGNKTSSSDQSVIGSGIAVVLLTVREPETTSKLLDPSVTLLELLKLNVPMPVMAVVSRSNVQYSPELSVKVATSRVDPTTREDKVAPAPGLDVTLTWLACTPAQLDGMPEHVRLKPVTVDSEVELTEKL
jgi:hypothetical protein